MRPESIVTEYLSSLEAGDTTRILRLFATDAIIHSPLYGERSAADFYPALFADTEQSRLTLRSVMTGKRDGRDILSFWFDFDWVLASGEPAPFTVVDVAELDDAGLIERLHIVYDTAPIRGAFDALR
ncbi:nuclear transport factor 2 family protein [Microbacterium kunmingense]|uniref:nuclear transport factor 2 family protein n=1 Tax=Microbacterium kunmingense TaxID=2915939 RepID=UPI00200614FA|nr:nuclear transport factor 2 family protein [Microbacterium kunmingense]